MDKYQETRKELMKVITYLPPSVPPGNNANDAEVLRASAAKDMVRDVDKFFNR